MGQRRSRNLPQLRPNNWVPTPPSPVKPRRSSDLHPVSEAPKRMTDRCQVFGPDYTRHGAFVPMSSSPICFAPNGKGYRSQQTWAAFGGVLATTE
jgi:hypothetical protein